MPTITEVEAIGRKGEDVISKMRLGQAEASEQVTTEDPPLLLSEGVKGIEDLSMLYLSLPPPSPSTSSSDEDEEDSDGNSSSSSSSSCSERSSSTPSPACPSSRVIAASENGSYNPLIGLDRETSPFTLQRKSPTAAQLSIDPDTTAASSKSLQSPLSPTSKLMADTSPRPQMCRPSRHQHDHTLHPEATAPARSTLAVETLNSKQLQLPPSPPTPTPRLTTGTPQAQTSLLSRQPGGRPFQSEPTTLTSPIEASGTKLLPPPSPPPAAPPPEPLSPAIGLPQPPQRPSTVLKRGRPMKCPIVSGSGTLGPDQPSPSQRSPAPEPKQTRFETVLSTSLSPQFSAPSRQQSARLLHSDAVSAVDFTAVVTSNSEQAPLLPSLLSPASWLAAEPIPCTSSPKRQQKSSSSHLEPTISARPVVASAASPRLSPSQVPLSPSPTSRLTTEPILQTSSPTLRQEGSLSRSKPAISTEIAVISAASLSPPPPQSPPSEAIAAPQVPQASVGACEQGHPRNDLLVPSTETTSPGKRPPIQPKPAPKSKRTRSGMVLSPCQETAGDGTCSPASRRTKRGRDRSLRGELPNPSPCHARSSTELNDPPPKGALLPPLETTAAENKARKLGKAAPAPPVGRRRSRSNGSTSNINKEFVAASCNRGTPNRLVPSPTRGATTGAVRLAISAKETIGKIVGSGGINEGAARLKRDEWLAKRRAVALLRSHGAESDDTGIKRSLRERDKEKTWGRGGKSKEPINSTVEEESGNFIGSVSGRAGGVSDNGVVGRESPTTRKINIDLPRDENQPRNIGSKRRKRDEARNIVGEDQNSTLEACSGTVPKLKSLGKETNSGEELSGIAMDHLQTTREEDIALVLELRHEQEGLLAVQKRLRGEIITMQEEEDELRCLLRLPAVHSEPSPPPLPPPPTRLIPPVEKQVPTTKKRSPHWREESLPTPKLARKVPVLAAYPRLPSSPTRHSRAAEKSNGIVGSALSPESVPGGNDLGSLLLSMPDSPVGSFTGSTGQQGASSDDDIFDLAKMLMDDTEDIGGIDNAAGEKLVEKSVKLGARGAGALARISTDRGGRGAGALSGIPTGRGGRWPGAFGGRSTSRGRGAKRTKYTNLDPNAHVKRYNSGRGGTSRGRIGSRGRRGI